MARYTSLFGCRVAVLYRAGELCLPAVGKLAADSGKSIFLEESSCHQGRIRTFRWEIPYPCIIRLTEAPAPPPAD
jgi:hypothetical protein